MDKLTDKEKFQLISLIRNKPAIWDSTPVARKNRNDEFISIAEEMSKIYKREFSVDYIRNAWRVLNICFNRERRKSGSKWQYYQEMSSFLDNINNNNTPKQQKREINIETKKTTSKKRVKRESLIKENNNKNDEFGLLKSILMNNDFNNDNNNIITTDEDSNLTMLDNEFNNDEKEADINNNIDNGNEALQIIEDSQINLIETPNINNNNNNKSIGGGVTAIINESLNKTIDTTNISNILEDKNEDDSMLLGKMVVCTHRILKEEGMDCEAVDFEKRLYELLINYKQKRAKNVNNKKDNN